MHEVCVHMCVRGEFKGRGGGVDVYVGVTVDIMVQLGNTFKMQTLL